MVKEDRIYNPDLAVLSSGIGVTPSEQVKLRDKKNTTATPTPPMGASLRRLYSTVVYDMSKALRCVIWNVPRETLLFEIYRTGLPALACDCRKLCAACHEAENCHQINITSLARSSRFNILGLSNSHIFTCHTMRQVERHGKYRGIFCADGNARCHSEIMS